MGRSLVVLAIVAVNQSNTERPPVQDKLSTRPSDYRSTLRQSPLDALRESSRIAHFGPALRNRLGFVPFSDAEGSLSGLISPFRPDCEVLASQFAPSSTIVGLGPG